jgi:hypothetical protein
MYIARLSLQPLTQATITDAIPFPHSIVKSERTLFTNWSSPATCTVNANRRGQSNGIGVTKRHRLLD